jgi:hypothetical protein
VWSRSAKFNYAICEQEIDWQEGSERRETGRQEAAKGQAEEDRQKQECKRPRTGREKAREVGTKQRTRGNKAKGSQVAHQPS